MFVSFKVLTLQIVIYCLNQAYSFREYYTPVFVLVTQSNMPLLNTEVGLLEISQMNDFVLFYFIKTKVNN